MFKSEKGITLVALVITIIVLLILAGVTLMLALGDKGIITQAGNAKAAQIEAEVAETMNMAILAAKTEMAAKVATQGSATFVLSSSDTSARTVNKMLTESLPSGGDYTVSTAEGVTTIKYETAAYRNATNYGTAKIEATLALNNTAQGITVTQVPTSNVPDPT